MSPRRGAPPSPLADAGEPRRALADARGPAHALVDAGDRGLLLRFPVGVTEDGLAAVTGALAALEAARLPGVVDLVPAFASLLVVYDPLRVAPARLRAAVTRALGRTRGDASPSAPRRLEIPVLYDPAVAPDLAPLAAEKGLSVDDLVARHSAPEYRCHMLGFRPGFPFLGGLPPELHAARLSTPRALVPAGAVGIGGPQTGIYPSAGPGGWRLVGRTPLVLFDPARAEPFLVRAGDLVKLVPVDRARFDALAAEAGA